MQDSNGDNIIINYQRYMPDMALSDTWWAVFYIAMGVVVLIALEWYGKNRRKNA